ncbi:MAG: hypothetical protein H6817_02305 [Phycisphaerales bacterium]|nr:hypothetical protein [Phycisphaerales bacterium]
MPDGEIDSPAVAPRRSASAATWVIAISLAVIAVCLVLRLDDGKSGQVFAQPSGSGGARGVFAFTGQLTRDNYGVFLVDVDAGTLWCYRFNSGKNTLVLAAARDWRYDRYLAEFSTEPPIETVKEQLEQQRAAARNAPTP